ncbi:cation:proton antiporter [Candidatus Nomurabacteria bacterium]|nr:cation:proton antiporter [Candidatus Nomurabacteria bacterium]
MDNVFLQVSILMGITVSIAFVMRLLRQPLMVAYLFAGLISGPLFLDLMHGDAHLFDAFAEFGVILLLFLVGLSLNFNHIKKIGKASVIAGLVQVIFTAVVGYALLLFLGFEHNSALYLAVALTFSSTIVIVKLLNDKNDTRSVYGRHVFGLMVIQDIIAVFIMMAFVQLSEGGSWIGIVGDFVVRIFALIALVYVLAKKVLPRILDHIARSNEFLFIFTMAWCFGLASALYALGFSLEIGAIVAGITLGSSPYQSEISSRIKPLRDFFIVIFFLILGSEMSISDFDAVLPVATVLSLFILFGNPFILYHTFRALKFTRRNSFLAGVTAAQVSEFGFILLILGRELGFIHSIQLQVYTFVALITIVVSSYAITYNEQMYRFFLPAFEFFGRDRRRQAEEKEERYDVWVFGYHRIGWRVCETLAEKKVSFAVVDFDPQVISKLRHRGIAAIFGDAADVEFLETLPLEKSKMIISTLPEYDDQETMVRHVRSKSDKPLIVTNLYDLEHMEELYEAGANYVMMPHLLGGGWVAELLKDKPWTKRTFRLLRQEQKTEMDLRHSHGLHL